MALATFQPIRDLARNWDIDIAGCLDEYLEDLEFSQETRECIIQAASNTNFNFSQAAIVLQNTSGIYSRKVDFLYSHIFKIQDNLFQACHPNGLANTKGDRESVDVDLEMEAFLNFDPYQEFLPLNDVLPVCNSSGIDLSDSEDDLNASFHSRRSIGVESSIIGLDSASRRLRRASFASTCFTADRSMTSDGDNLNGFTSGHSLLSAAGTLRLQTGVCGIGDDGILRMPGSVAQEREEFLDIDSPEDFEKNDTSFDAFDHPNGMSGDHDDDDREGFITTGNMRDDDALQDSRPSHGAKRRVTFADSCALASRDAPKENPKVDPWAMLSWDAPDVRKPRPLRIGKTIVLPSTVDKPPSECVTGARTRQSARIKTLRIPRSKLLQLSSNTSSDTFQGFSFGKKRTLELNLKNSALSYGQEFAYIAKATARRQSEERRLQRLGLLKEASRHIVPSCHDVGAAENVVAVFGDACLDDDDDNFDNGVGEGFDFVDSSSPMETNTGITSMDDIFRMRNNEDDEETDSTTPTFEELCRAHISAFSRGAEKYAMETKLNARVGKWQVKLLPLLEEEERRPVFDIHRYGETVIHEMEKQINKYSCSSSESTHKTIKTVPFRDISRDCQPFDVCRMFLAALSLSNSENIKFTSDSTLNSLHLELLSIDMERPMENYFAPSVMDAAF